MWTRHATTELVSLADDGDLAVWTAEHDGYESLAPPRAAPAHRSPGALARPGSRWSTRWS